MADLRERLLADGYEEAAPGLYVLPLPPKDERVRCAIRVGRRMLQHATHPAVVRSWQRYLDDQHRGVVRA